MAGPVRSRDRAEKPVSVDPEAVSASPAPEIENLLAEHRTFPPSPAFAAQANATADLYDEAERDYAAFWAAPRTRAGQLVHAVRDDARVGPAVRQVVRRRRAQHQPTTASTATSSAASATRSPTTGSASPATPGRSPIATSSTRSRKCANALRELGVRKGDRVAIYMPMIPELPIAMLACARIGAPHTVVFGGFSRRGPGRPDQRLPRRRCSSPPTAAGGAARRSASSTTPTRRSPSTPTIEHGDRRRPHRARRATWSRAATTGGTTSSAARAPTARPSRSTPSTCSTCSTRRARRPSRRASCTPRAGYLLGTAYTHEMIFDIKPDDVYWCAADIGWVTGHSYIVYGPLANATTGVLYEGAPDTPDWDRWWQIVEDYKVTILYTAPTAIRAFMKQGAAVPGRARPLVAARARVGRRADQPRGLALVPRAHRRRQRARSSTRGGRPRPGRS